MGNINNQNNFIEMKNIMKDFSGIRALSNISFNVRKGEIHCLVGENGAGKSTLMKILSGAYSPDSGEIIIDGQIFKTLTPKLSQELGINIIYQENLLVPSMNIIENMFIGHEITNRFGFIKWKEMSRLVQDEMAFLGIHLNPYRKIEDLSVSEQQFVKILKALIQDPKLLIMDEPTSMFNVEDANRVLKFVQRITDKGISIIYISHFLKEIEQIADRITVMRDGSIINTITNHPKTFSFNQITKDMVGRPVELFYKKEVHEIGETILDIKDLQLEQHSPKISFSLKKGEILGIAGMVGAGRTEIVRAISGADRFYKGTIRYKGKNINVKKPKDTIKIGIAHITEDRQRYGLMLDQNIIENMTIVGMDKKINGFFINVKNHIPFVKPIVDDLNVKAASMYQHVRYLSGGNQQKVVLGKWLFMDIDVFIFDEPTRGIDVNSKTEFYKLMSTLTKEGKSIILISSDMPELISMSDRVLVVRKGNISKELMKEDISEESIIKSALEENDEWKNTN